MVTVFEREPNPELGDNGRFKYAPQIVHFQGQELPANHIITFKGGKPKEGDQVGYVRGGLGILYWIYESVVVKHE